MYFVEVEIVKQLALYYNPSFTFGELKTTVISVPSQR